MQPPKIIVGLVIFLAVAFAAWRLRKHGDARTVPPVPRLQTEHDAAMASRIAQLDAAAGLIRRAFPRDDQNVFVRVGVRAVGGCSPGDFDAIQYELAHSPKDTRILLTIESPVGGSKAFQPMVQEISLAQIVGGFSHQFQLPRDGKKRPLGVYLCKDSSHRGTCAGTEIADINHIFNVYLVELPDHGYKASDKTYFFQFLDFDGEGTLAGFASARPGEEKLSQLTNLIRAEGGTDEPKPVAERVGSLTKTLVSLPARLSGIVRVDLPHADRQECEKTER